MNVKCSICLEFLTENCEVKSTPCGHLFHSLCLERSVQHRNNCPKCRKSCTGSIRVYMDSDGTDSPKYEDKFFKLLQNAAEKGSLAKYKMIIEDEDNKNPTKKD